MDLHDKEIEIMLGHKDLLTEFYHDWLDCDTPLGEALSCKLYAFFISLNLLLYGTLQGFIE